MDSDQIDSLLARQLKESIQRNGKITTIIQAQKTQLEEKTKLLEAAHEAMNQQSLRITDLLVSNNEFEERARKAERLAKLRQDILSRHSLWSAEETSASNQRIINLIGAIDAIKQATLKGEVCKDVAWFSGCETLHDYCERVLEDDDKLVREMFTHLKDRKT